MYLSVIIPAYKEEKVIESTLRSIDAYLKRQTYDYEVLVVVDGVKDKTADLAKKFSKDLNLRIIKEEKRGRGAARARGFKEAKGEIILSTDADVSLYSGWIETMVSEIKKDSIAVTTPCKIIDRSALNNLFFNYSLPVFMTIYRIVFGHFWLSGFSFGIKKDIYLKSGGFDSSLHAQEDTDLSFRVAKLGKIKFLNKPITVSGRRLKDGIFAAYFDYWRSYFNFFVLKKNGYLDNPR